MIKVSLISLLLLLARGILWLFNLLLVAPLFDPLQNLPGPEGAALQNHFSEVMDPQKSPTTHESWKQKFGKTFRFHGFGKHDYRMMSFDFRVISHILTSPVYEKPWQTRSVLARLIGRGIFSMEGAEHKQQRRLIGPAFTGQSIKALTPIFFQKAEELCERWDDLIDKPFSTVTNPTDPPPAYVPFATAVEKFKGVTLDVAHWISRASFDVIGLTGFDYHFNSLEDETEDVYLAYRRLFDMADKGAPLRTVIELYFPIIRKIWPDERTKIMDASLRVVDKAGKKLIAQKKAMVISEQDNEKVIQEKDILSLLIKANLSTDPAKRLSDEELLNQCSTFLLAGSDSVSLALAWCLHFLSQNPAIQTRLRDEILSSTSTSSHVSHEPALSKHFDTELRLSPPPSYPSGEQPSFESWEALEKLPYLDAVVRETLRICPPVHSTIRVAVRDDQIPVSSPVILQDGTTVEKDGYISIRKGSYIHIPIEGLNLAEDIWGNDAQEFNPDRWACLPSSARPPAHPGLGNMMTFGFGPHSCLGYKFTITEMKIFLGMMVSRFVFVPKEGIKISKYNAILTRPYVVDKWELGTQLPVVVRRFRP
ncbi:cytochrome P450 [Collybia nuda]|uniref:Cytochrome P450 n=1 Tax=Collybia nuda TaxID=64659 RepID=A0A9P5XTM4_9AGAR|nr:cytochrome P450 [Collybia nuda]